jgi:hypothetical protein
MGRLSKKAVHVITERQFQAEGHTARTAAHTARQIDKQRVFGIHHPALLFKLRFQTLPGNCIAQKKRARVFIINKETVWVGLCCLAPLLHRHAVIFLIFDDNYAVAA